MLCLCENQLWDQLTAVCNFTWPGLHRKRAPLIFLALFSQIYHPQCVLKDNSSLGANIGKQHSWIIQCSCKEYFAAVRKYDSLSIANLHLSWIRTKMNWETSIHVHVKTSNGQCQGMPGIALHIHVTLEATQHGKRYLIIKSTSSPNNLYITSKHCKSGCYAYRFPRAKRKTYILGSYRTKIPEIGRSPCPH